MSRTNPRAVCDTCAFLEKSRVGVYPTCRVSPPSERVKNGTRQAFWPAISNTEREWCGQHQFTQTTAQEEGEQP